MGKKAVSLCVALLITLMLSTNAKAVSLVFGFYDKETTIVVKNAPEHYYLDIFTNTISSFLYTTEYALNDVDMEIVKDLKEYDAIDWHPEYTKIEKADIIFRKIVDNSLKGSLVGKKEGDIFKHEIFNLPNLFKICVMDDSNKIQISEPISFKGHSNYIYYDYATNQVTYEYKNYFVISLTFILPFLISVFILIMSKTPIKKSSVWIWIFSFFLCETTIVIICSLIKILEIRLAISIPITIIESIIFYLCFKKLNKLTFLISLILKLIIITILMFFTTTTYII